MGRVDRTVGVKAEESEGRDGESRVTRDDEAMGSPSSAASVGAPGDDSGELSGGFADTFDFRGFFGACAFADLADAFLLFAAGELCFEDVARGSFVGEESREAPDDTFVPLVKAAASSQGKSVCDVDTAALSFALLFRRCAPFAFSGAVVDTCVDPCAVFDFLAFRGGVDGGRSPESADGEDLDGGEEDP